MADREVVAPDRIGFTSPRNMSMSIGYPISIIPVQLLKIKSYMKQLTDESFDVSACASMSLH